MAANRRRDTGPELALRSILHATGLRYRVDFPIIVDGVRIRPDIVFRARRLAVFVDGCFWHSCPEHATQPRSNSAYWKPKLASTVQRDHRQTLLLRKAGWTVLRIWEHELAADAAAAVIHQLAALSESGARQSPQPGPSQPRVLAPTLAGPP
jgi:DNA mismatch endonuclease (patch repair protein)